MVGGRDVQILLVEPDAAEARCTAAILKRARVRCHVTIVHDSAQALAHLRRESHHYRSPRPNLILLDTDNLPQGGQELLTAIKCDENIGHIPLIFLSSSETARDVRRAYDLEANCYVQKPLTEDNFSGVLETTRDFWLNVAKLPSE